MLNVHDDGGVRHITLNRPERRNAFDAALIQALTGEFRRLREAGADVRAVVLSGAGESFCSGGDLEWMKASAKLSRQENLEDVGRLFDLFKSLRDVPVPVVAKVFGHCFGGGIGLIAACDIVAAEAKTQFCFAEIKWGLSPAVISSFVRERAAPHVTREWFLTAKVFDAAEAARGGLVNFSGDAAAVDQYVAQTLSLIRKAGPNAVRATKRLHQASSGIDWDRARAETTALIADLRVSAEGQEGLASFFAKSKPSWAGR